MKKLFTTLFGLIAAGFFSQEKKVDSVHLQKELQEVTITGKKKLIERKVDRTVFNVENSVAAQGGDAMDALKVTPGVKINGNDIKLTGKNSVKVMVNDKIVQLGGEELQNYLKSIPTANIQKIEVITNPPAKYDAEGNSGLINIQLKEVKQDNWSATLRSSYQQGFYAQFVEGAGFSYRKNKLAVLADLNYGSGDWIYTNDIHYYYPEERWDQTIFKRTNRKSLSPLMNISYDISEKTTLGAQFSGAFTKRKSNDYNDNFSHSYSDNSRLKYYKTYGEEHKSPEIISLNLNLSHKLGKDGQKFSVDADYFESELPQQNVLNSTLSDYEANSVDNQFADNNSSQNITNYSLKTDWEFPLKWAEISFGGKISNITTVNLVDTKFFRIPTNILLSSRDDHFEYTENNEAFYLNASKNLGKKWEAKAGLRGEYTQTKAHSLT